MFKRLLTATSSSPPLISASLHKCHLPLRSSSSGVTNLLSSKLFIQTNTNTSIINNNTINILHRSFSCTLKSTDQKNQTNNTAEKSSNIENTTSTSAPVEKKTSFLRNVVEFIGEFLGDMTAMLVWRFLIFIVPILALIWFYFGTSGVTTALTLAWLFIVALLTSSADSTNKSEKK